MLQSLTQAKMMVSPQTDSRLLDGQARIVTKHLRFHYKSTVAVPLERTYSLVEGYTKPRVKVFEYHVDGEKHYQGVCARGGRTYL